MVLAEDGPLAGDLRAAGVEVIVRPLAVLRRQLMTPRGLAEVGRALCADALALTRLARHRRVALIHSNTSVLLGGPAAARLARIPHVWHVREILARFGPAWPPYRRLLSGASALVCVSEATRAQFPRGGAMVIRDGLAVAAWRAQRQVARRALGLPQEAPVVAVLGRITEWKGQEVLARALAEPPLRRLGAIGLVAGDAWPGAEDRRESLLSVARLAGVEDRLRLAGFRDDIENVYGAADVIAVPSTQPDPLPNAALEAAAAGCAVLASAHGGLPEIIRDGVTGRLVAPGDVAALAAVSAELLQDPDECRRLGDAAAADVRARFAPERLLARLQALYDTLLS